MTLEFRNKLETPQSTYISPSLLHDRILVPLELVSNSSGILLAFDLGETSTFMFCRKFQNNSGIHATMGFP